MYAFAMAMYGSGIHDVHLVPHFVAQLRHRRQGHVAGVSSGTEHGAERVLGLMTIPLVESFPLTLNRSVLPTLAPL